MADDGAGYAVSIPSIFISKEDGDLLTNYTENNPGKPIDMQITFDTNKRNNVSLILGLSISYRETFQLARDFKKYYQFLQTIGDLSVIYEFYTSYDGFIFNFTKSDPDCLGAGRYCQSDPDDFGVGQGRDIV